MSSVADVSMQEEAPASAGPNHEELLDTTRLQRQTAAAACPIPLLREAVAGAAAVLDERYWRNQSIDDIVRGRAWVVDEVLKLAWQAQHWPDPGDISLVAVGGYGRGELLPHSDIDLLILTRSGNNGKFRNAISAFLAMLWDIGLDIGQSVRSVRQCRQEALRDITIATALMESRTLIGPDHLHRKMMALVNGPRVWPIKKFVRAKLDEQAARHRKYHDIDHALEPNVKTSPGGLRDIQTIAWVAKRQFGANSFRDLLELGFLKESEAAMLNKGRQFLWKLRYGLHVLEGRNENRLLFDKQRELARLFGYQDDERSLGVEKLMQQYYRMVAVLRSLNDVLLQHLDEAILREGERTRVETLNSRFRIRNGYIEAAHSGVFERHPPALLEIFVLMAQNPRIRGIRAATTRLLRDHRHLIDEDYRNDIRNVSLFIELLRSPHEMALQLRRMSRYGILDRYLPEFGQISGQMQHDLFHIYTVDAHTLQVVENMRRFRRPDAVERFPVAAQVFRNLPKVELLYIAGLYHDIAKGRGGDHSELGMLDAIAFCRRHRLSDWDAKLVSWLVGKHLLMSMTAQRKDIDDPEEINEFARAMGDKLHLDYLYVLTVADICATNPSLWTSWRATLLRQLYENTKRALRQGLENPLDREERIADKKNTARLELHGRGMSDGQIDEVWENASGEYFVRESTANVVWHTEAVANFRGQPPLISIKAAEEAGEEAGATWIFIYTTQADFLFANCTAAFDKLRLNIVGARIFSFANGWCMHNYTVLEHTGRPVGKDPERLQEIHHVLRDYQGRGRLVRPASYRRSRKARYFGNDVHVTCLNNPRQDFSTLEINCPDQPGILACVGKILADHRVNLQDARITTLGERVEDLFFITDGAGSPLRQSALTDKLQAHIKARLEEHLAV